MSGASLGGLLLFFGLNQLMLFDGITTYIIATLFILFGVYIGIFNFKAYKHYRSFVDEEKKLKNLQDDQSKLEKKIKGLQDDLSKNKTDQQNQTDEIAKQKAALEQLKSQQVNQ